MPSPLLTKNKIGSEINAKRFTKLFNNNGNSCSDLKNIHKKILFNHTLNINRDIYGYKNIKNNNPINLDIKTNKIKFIEKLELKDNKDILNTNKNSINFNRGNMSIKNYNRYKLLLTNNKNKENTNNQKEEKEKENNNFLDKMIKRFKSNKEKDKDKDDKNTDKEDNDDGKDDNKHDADDENLVSDCMQLQSVKELGFGGSRESCLSNFKYYFSRASIYLFIFFFLFSWLNFFIFYFIFYFFFGFY